jgi:hypothetical protein
MEISIRIFIEVFMAVFSKHLISVLIASSLLAACGSNSSDTPAVLGSDSKITEKAAGTEPVFRFAKISNGAYFYTSNAVEAETINALYPDFRYEGVAFQHVTGGGGSPVYRFAKYDGGYFYTASEPERAYVQATLAATFRFEGVGFYSTAGSGLPVYRVANLNNGGYLFTASAAEYAYAGSLPGWRQEGLAFNAPAGFVISGTVSDGLPWGQANITVVDVNGLQRTGTTSTIGTYFVDGAGLTAPIVAMATYKQPGAIGAYMMAVLPSLPANSAATTMNITPMTDVVTNYAASSAVQGVALIQNPSVWNLIGTMNSRYNTAVAAVRTTLGGQLAAQGIPAADFDPTRLAFAANQTGQAAVIRDTLISLSGAGGWFSNRLSGDVAAASVYLTNANIASPPVLPASTKPVFPKANIDALAAAWKACLAIPAASRITVNAADVVTFINPTCSSIGTSNYLQAGDNFATRWRGVLKEPAYDANSFQEIKFRSYSDLDGKELAGVQLRLLANDTKYVNSLEVFQKVNGVWVVAGNQRPYAGSVTFRTDEFSRVPYGTTSSAFESITSRLSLIFDPSHPSMANIRAVRVTGPGLPTAGIVLGRSVSCGTQGFMTISNKTGAVVDTSLPPVNYLYTTGVTPNFNIARTVTVGTAPWPAAGTDRNFADTPANDVALAIAPLSKYTLEYFDFTPSSTVPVATYTTTLNGSAKNPDILADYKVKPTASFISDWLIPTGAKSAAQTSVDFFWSFNQVFQPQVSTLQAYAQTRNLAQTNTAANDYFFKSPSYDSIAIPDIVFAINKPFAADSLTNGVSTSPQVALIAGAANLSCTNQTAQLRAISGAGDYREFVFRVAQEDFSQVQHVKALQN